MSNSNSIIIILSFWNWCNIIRRLVTRFFKIKFLITRRPPILIFKNVSFFFVGGFFEFFTSITFGWAGVLSFVVSISPSSLASEAAFSLVVEGFEICGVGWITFLWNAKTLNSQKIENLKIKNFVEKNQKCFFWKMFCAKKIEKNTIRNFIIRFIFLPCFLIDEFAQFFPAFVRKFLAVSSDFYLGKWKKVDKILKNENYNVLRWKNWKKILNLFRF